MSKVFRNCTVREEVKTKKTVQKRKTINVLKWRVKIRNQLFRNCTVRAEVRTKKNCTKAENFQQKKKGRLPRKTALLLKS